MLNICGESVIALNEWNQNVQIYKKCDKLIRKNGRPRFFSYV